jgi:hypothetical protein
MTRYSQIIRTISNAPRKHILDMISISNIKNVKLDIKKEDDYNTIQSILHSYCGSIYFDEKNGKFYFK